ncbi:(2E,6E)-farnesyl diphosphate synthase [Candidatus Erwinia haradaeae]|uniref:Farnesyl diphosphate synthase n=1 Tax=Candidatus Erwinia haradaeae TaxID=1922217 RepID=A0A451D3X3_9GAMM|nr:(2E,6E)-farnesyl diphosphate synthase [Candidatus Erwinia haradaeae]VFP80366.1 Farnesyl diphosphate synthase [Candidatus Erwinia haradaeae]
MSFNMSLNSHYNRINVVLKDYLSKLPLKKTPLVKAMEYSVLLGGKRLRPLLVYATGNMLHVQDASLDASAAAIECMHAYSLIHDDLPAIDNEVLRRDQATCHSKFGEDIAILAGDALQTLAFSILINSQMPGVILENRIAMLSELAHASGVAGMCGGQILDLISEGQTITIENLENIHQCKTGALIRSAVRLGALTAGDIGIAFIPDLDQFSDAIGLAFQVQDDILDVAKDSKSLQKRTMSESRFRKSTYPELIGLDNSRAKIRDLYNKSLSVLEIFSKQKYNTAMLQALASFIITRDQ